MDKEDKELLLQDLCARLPYHVRCKIWLKDGTTEEGPLDLEHNYEDVLRDAFYYNKIKDIKPYLRPMNSMTNEEFVYFMGIRGQNLTDYEIQHLKEDTFKSLSTVTIVNTLQQYRSKLNWLAKNNFDYNGLIERGLAIDMTK